MNKRIQELAEQAGMYVDLNGNPWPKWMGAEECEVAYAKFAELLVEAVLDQVKERAYYTGDRDWSDEVDRPWIQLEFGYGALAK